MNTLFSVAEIELTYKSKVKPCDRPQITSPKQSYDILLHNWSDQLEWVEEFNLLLLNRANRVLAFYNVSKGGQAGTVVDAKVVFAAALKLKATGIILAHNHPSGNLHPSMQDIAVTKKLVEGGKLLDITILDHLIVTPYGYYSFAEEGKL
ncbi:MAG: JAB domain-containing protein [Bacteroidota bacterium]